IEAFQEALSQVEDQSAGKLFRLDSKYGKLRAVEYDAEDLVTLGIVVDADKDVAARWQAVTDKLRTCGYKNIPKQTPETGWIHTQSKLPKIGVWLMPDNKLPGMLEDFVAYLIPSEDRLKEKVEAILTEIEIEKINSYSSTHRQKAFIHTWLAWQEKPGMPMGQAITAKVLSDHSAIASIFLNWLNNLFNTK
ncbi:MAG: DUF3226 domain-containing protein, partial [Spirulinaceae cyanobacterium]